jgi:hypothetical protein
MRLGSRAWAALPSEARLGRQVTDLPWDDLERLPALLRQIERTAAEQLVDLRREYHLWRTHQPALRREVPPLPMDREQWPGRRVARMLARIQEDVHEALEDLGHTELTE